ncbi:MAG: aquaporin [Puniceicoccales bacterium]|jgi:aquaporin Z|nr:aquaporin [Puniceicoccales bacterium]
MNKYIVELIGTFFLVLTVATTAILLGAASPLTPLAIASALLVMIYAGGHVSGAHYNPAVTLGVWIRGRCASKDAVLYVAFQLIGAALAVLAAKALYPDQAKVLASLAPVAQAVADTAKGSGATCPVAAVFPVILAEFLFTFALVYVVLNVATAKRNAGTGFYGLAIGFTVLVGAVAVGRISGGAFNPAVAVGISLLAKTGPLTFCSIWQHLLGELLAAAAAGLLFRTLNADDR